MFNHFKFFTHESTLTQFWDILGDEVFLPTILPLELDKSLRFELGVPVGVLLMNLHHRNSSEILSGKFEYTSTWASVLNVLALPTA